MTGTAETETVRRLSVAQWHALAQAGTMIPMRIPINGVSMLPTIRRNRDLVTILPLQERPQVGDIVLFADPRTAERYVLHRLWRTAPGQVLTWGDNCAGPDGWLPEDCVWGRAVRIERDRHVITPDRRRGLLLARIWHPVARLRTRGYALALPIWKKIRPFIKRTEKHE